MRKSIYILLLCIPFFGNAQMVKPSVFNMGGGFSLGFPVNAEWSIGESAAIGTYLNSALQLNAGVLQPKSDVVTSIPEPGTIVFGNQISISPNPSYDKVKVILKMQKPGKATISIFNIASQLYKRFDFSEVDLIQTKVVELNNLPTGIFFFNVLFQPTVGSAQNGIFKIIRL
jgi:hypothetical protein